MATVVDLKVTNKEFQLMLYFLQPERDQNYLPLEKEEINTINWDLFLKSVYHHRVHPAIYKTITEEDYDFVPKYVKKQLHQAYVSNTMNMLKLAGEMERINKALNDSQIRMLMLKGPILSYQIYGDLSSRTSGDLDILIEFDELSNVTKILHSLGYEIAYNPPRILKDWRVRNHHIEFFNIKTKTEIEVHWRLHPGPSTEPSFDHLWSSRQEINAVTKTPIQCLGNESLFYYLITHGARHGWFRLRWLTDIIDLKKKVNVSSELIREHHALHLFQQASYLSSLLFQYKFSPNNSFSNRVTRLANEAFGFIYNEINIDHPQTQEWEEKGKRYLFNIKPFSQKVFYVSRKFQANSWDAQYLPLPKQWHFLYLPLRPILWLLRRTS